MILSIPILNISILLMTFLSIGGYVYYLSCQQQKEKEKIEKPQVSQKEKVLERTQTAAVATAV